MTHFWRRLSFVFVAITFVAACNHMEPPYNVKNDAVPSSTQQKLSSEQVGNIIAKTALRRGWIVDKVKPGLLHCTLKWNDHSATAGVETAYSCLDSCSPKSVMSAANITYSKESYSISIDPSQTPDEQGDVTYRRYNRYIQKLQAEIDKNLSKAAFE